MCDILSSKTLILGIIRHHDSCAATFLNDGGYSGLKNALEKTSPQLKAKAAFLTNCLYAEYNQRMSGKNSGPLILYLSVINSV